jgi:8-oxo-dGTP pyrophosphatase MutT (NUDIX family)
MIDKIIKIIFDLLHSVRKIYWKTFNIKTQGVRVILYRHNKVLLVKHRYGNLWVFPGGGMKKGESSEDVAIREIKEEVNIEINSFVGKLGVYKNTHEGKNDTVTVLVSEEFMISPFKKNFEVKEAEWFDIYELPKNTSRATKDRLEEYKKWSPDLQIIESDW